MYFKEFDSRNYCKKSSRDENGTALLSICKALDMVKTREVPHDSLVTLYTYSDFLVNGLRNEAWRRYNKNKDLWLSFYKSCQPADPVKRYFRVEVTLTSFQLCIPAYKLACEFMNKKVVALPNNFLYCILFVSPQDESDGSFTCYVDFGPGSRRNNLFAYSGKFKDESDMVVGAILECIDRSYPRLTVNECLCIKTACKAALKYTKRWSTDPFTTVSCDDEKTLMECYKKGRLYSISSIEEDGKEYMKVRERAEEAYEASLIACD